MFKIENVVKSDYANQSAQEILQAPVTALLGVTENIAKLIENLEIFSIFDLASSRIFKGAADIVQATVSPDTVYSKFDGIPADVLDRDAEGGDIRDLPGKDIQVIAGIGPNLGPQLAEALDVKTIRDLSLWPPFQAARNILDAAFGISGDEDPEAPGELIPTAGDYPTERVFYDTIILNEIGGTNGMSSLEKAGQIDVLGNGDKPGFKAPAIATRLTFSQSWYPHGVSLGQLLHSVALAPGESTKIAMIDWSRRETAEASETVSQQEQLSATMQQNRSISEVTQALATESQRGFSKTESSSSSGSVGLGVGGILSSVMFGAAAGGSSNTTKATSYSSSRGRRSLSASMSQNIMDRTQQHASSCRTRRASVVREVSEEESESITSRVVTNYNHMHALSIHYYEVVQLYRVATKLEKCERCLCIPMKLIDFSNEEIIKRNRSALIAATGDDYVRRLLRDAGGPVTLKLQLVHLYDYLSTVRLPELRRQRAMAPIMNRWSVDMEINKCQIEMAGIANAMQADNARALGIVGSVVASSMNGEWNIPSDTTLTAVLHPGNLVTNVFLLYEDGTEERLGDNGTPAVPPKISELARLALGLDADAIKDAEEDSDLHQWITLSLSLDGKDFVVRVPFMIPKDRSRVTLLDFRPPSSSQLAANYLNESKLYYSQVVWLNTDPQTLTTLLAGLTYEGHSVASIIDPDPVGVAGNYLVFLCPDEMERDKKWWSWRKDNVSFTKVDQELVPLPSGGVFAEAVLGRCNSAEKLDITRFWNWQDSPLPEKAPEIAPISAGTRTTTEDIRPGNLDQPLIQIQTPQALPDPTGLSAIISALTTSNMFRDMSGLAETIALAQSGMQTAAESATAAGSQAGANMATYGQTIAELTKAAVPLIATALTGVPIPMTDSKTNISNAGATLNKAAQMDKSAKSGDGAASGGSSPGGSSTNSGGGATGGTTAAGANPLASTSGSYEGEAVRTLIGGGGAPGIAGSFLRAIAGAALGAVPQETANDEPKPTILLARTGEEFEQGYVELGGVEHPEEYRDGAKTKGYRGIISVEGSDKEFHTIERANGYKHLPAGTYSAVMKGRNAHPDKHEIRILGTYTGGRIYVHAANCPDELEGCIAPGKVKEDYGVSESGAALAEIIELLGGWEEDKELAIVVTGYKTTAG